MYVEICEELCEINIAWFYNFIIQNAKKNKWNASGLSSCDLNV